MTALSLNPLFWPLVAIVLAIVNLAALAAIGLDKRQSRRHGWRIPEQTLMLWAVAGGSMGAIAGMWLFRHKTRHPLFTIGLPLILALQLIAVYWAFAA